MKHFLLLLFLTPVFGESLSYTINWPSGLSLGEAQLSSQAPAQSNGNWNFSLEIDASIPAYAVRDDYKSTATSEYCSVQFDKTFAHGQHRNQETITFDQNAHSATRETSGGGKSDISVGTCARDPLAYIQFLRHELAEGRLPQPQQVIYGASYQVRVDYSGKQMVRYAGQNVEADRIVASIKGPASSLDVEMFFSRDAAHTPLVVRIPVALGTFSLELQK